MSKYFITISLLCALAITQSPNKEKPIHNTGVKPDPIKVWEDEE